MKTIEVNDIHMNDTMKLEKYLSNKFTVPHILICKFIRTKQIRLKRAEQYIKDSHVKYGDIIEIYGDLKPGVSSKKVHKTYGDIRHIAEVIHENDDILIINKPKGLAVQRGTGIKTAVVDFLQHNELIVHRLDKNTSGVLLVAKNEYTAKVLGDAFRNKTITKFYIAVVQWRLRSKKVVNVPLLKTDEYIIPHPHGQDAITEFYPISHTDNYTLVAIKPITGRTHQIRVHAQYLKTPVLGDTKYGDSKSHRMFLHAYAVRLDGAYYFAPFDKVFQQYLGFFNFSEQKLLNVVNNL